jgi:hypothetical protein
MNKTFRSQSVQKTNLRNDNYGFLPLTTQNFKGYLIKDKFQLLDSTMSKMSMNKFNIHEDPILQNFIKNKYKRPKANISRDSSLLTGDILTDKSTEFS